MITLQKAEDRGYADHGWLESYHSFSFANYYNPDRMQFSALRVINDDIIGPTFGFGTHPHKNMEIFTYVLSGELEHKDTLNNGDVLKYGDVQLMSTGEGVKHSEFNPSETNPVHLLQIWINPNILDTLPTYQQNHYTPEDKLNKLKLIISENGRDNSIVIKQDTSIYASILEEMKSLKYSFGKDRKVYIHLAKGEIVVNKITLFSGDAVEITNESEIEIKAINHSEFLLLDLP